MKFVVFAGSLMVIISCSKREKGTAAVRADTVSTSVMARPDSLRANPSQPTDRVLAQAIWQYEKTVDGSGGPVYKGSLTAANKLRFAYPYTGGSTATLTIRTGNTGTNIYVEVSNGQFNRSFQGGTARVRFDGKPPVTYSLSAAANGRANIVFFDEADGFVERIRTARTVSIQVEFPGQRVQKIEFSTAGLRWNH